MIEGFGLGAAALDSVQLCQIVQIRGDVGTVRTERLLSDREGTLVERLGLGIAPFGLICIGEDGDQGSIILVAFDISHRSVASFNLLQENDGLVVIAGLIKLVRLGEILTYCESVRSACVGRSRRERDYPKLDDSNRQRGKRRASDRSKRGSDHAPPATTRLFRECPDQVVQTVHRVIMATPKRESNEEPGRCGPDRGRSVELMGSWEGIR